MSRIDLPPQPNGYKVQWSYLPKQFSAENIEEILGLFRKFVPTGDFTLGKPVRDFEEKFAAMIGSRQAIGVNSGTDGIKLGLKALGVGPGDEVITTANTFIATVGAIGELFARPVFVDCTDNFCMDVSQVEASITKKTKALVPVHLAGQMTNMPALMELARKHNLPVVEDSCQCILGNIDGKNAGTYGRSGAFSLHPLKNLNVWSDGGMIVTDDDDFATELRQLRNHGLAGRDSVVRMGCNSRLDSIQAVVGNWLIGQVDFITNTRIRNAAFLDRGLSPHSRHQAAAALQQPQTGVPPLHRVRRAPRRAGRPLQGQGHRGEGALPRAALSAGRPAPVRLQEGRFSRDGPARRDDDLVSGARAPDRGAARVYRPDGRRVLWGLRWRSMTFPT